MALSKKITADAEDPKAGMTITEFLEFAQAVESALTTGRIFRDDIFRGRVGFSAQIQRLSVDDKDNDRGVMHTA